MTKFGRDGVSNISADVEELTNFINEQSSEQKILITQFKSAMNRFASERSLDSCLEALNVCMQLTNTRRRLLESYQRYSRLLENEITRINRETMQKK
jgi:trehalose-6-phosphate synthase